MHANKVHEKMFNSTHHQHLLLEWLVTKRQEITSVRGTWVAQLVEHPTLDFSSDHDLSVPEFKLRIGLCADSSEPARVLSLPLSK